MSAVPPARLLVIIGSGETSPTMVSVHGELLRRLGQPPAPAVLLDTPFGFQENADDIAMRAALYFRQSLGLEIGIATLRNRERATPLELETFLARLADSRLIFAGPGSPSYALKQWLGSPVPEALRQRLRDGGCVVFASAAAVGLGRLALPVYEIYKVGEEPRWLEGLDLLAEAGLSAAVIPHFDNTEGGTHDTRYCYMGLRRLRMLEEQLPEGVDILGVDEHTAAILDLAEGTLAVRGRGGVTLRRQGMERRFEAGRLIPISELSAPAQLAPTDVAVRVPGGDRGGVGRSPAGGSASPFAEAVLEQRERAERALAAGEPSAAAAALLEIEAELHAWDYDTLSSDERDRARSALRQLVVRLGELAREGAVDPRLRVAPLVDGILSLRRSAREDRRFDEADRLRDLLSGCGVEVRDTPEGTDWQLLRPAPVRA